MDNLDKIKVVLYCRTSTNAQNIISQTDALFNECEENEWEIKKAFKDEGVSRYQTKRDGFCALIKYIKKNKVDKIVVWDMTRISGDVEFCKSFICDMTELGVSIFFVERQFETLRNNNSLNISVFNLLMDEIKYAGYEVGKLKKRLVRGYNTFIINGGKVGRKTGYRKSDTQILFDYEIEANHLIEGYSLRMINCVTGTSINTIQKVKNILIKNGTVLKKNKISLYNVYQEIDKKTLNKAFNKIMLKTDKQNKQK